MVRNSLPLRRLTARSAILSVLLGAHPAQASAATIVHMATELGLQESTVRAALTRMVSAGDLERDDATYRLTPRLLNRQKLQDLALDPILRPYDGDWRLAIVTTGAEAAADRTLLRESLQANKFGEIREGVWGRPANLGSAEITDSHRLTYMTARPDDATELATRLFHPTDWADTATKLLAALATAATMRDRLEVAAAVVRHILHDPILPPEFLPTPWPGADLRQAYRTFRTEFTAFATAHVP
ncbi:PaaX family transcriptional regulator C-terminal domain-containing protein [Nocardia caishijiensis]|uniref:PaaX family transcriptional regulator n=1 Tax=Nocardia caishijiensis TaxID=184756 RepID=A0ABQ6YIY7_9NOCA|nr:PaaX family transcriptional regulator C-terminal domain-containing protein [Nocardia caishijiensis]KAF0845753.1 PaaX family transcriptional regulator [Nocardia caishijiensis]